MSAKQTWAEAMGEGIGAGIRRILKSGTVMSSNRPCGDDPLALEKFRKAFAIREEG